MWTRNQRIVVLRGSLLRENWLVNAREGQEWDELMWTDSWNLLVTWITIFSFFYNTREGPWSIRRYRDIGYRDEENRSSGYRRWVWWDAMKGDEMYWHCSVSISPNMGSTKWSRSEYEQIDWYDFPHRDVSITLILNLDQIISALAIILISVPSVYWLKKIKQEIGIYASYRWPSRVHRRIQKK